MKTVKFALFISCIDHCNPCSCCKLLLDWGYKNWSDLNNWATTSGGTTKHSQVPTLAINVYFDANSFGASGQSMTINVSNAVCKDFI